MEKVIAFTDGASRNNPGKGGWGAIVIYPKSSGVLCVDELGGADPHTTNNRMEIGAFKAVLEHMNDFYQNDTTKKVFTIYTDSSYVRNAFTKWIDGWAKSDWVTKGKTQVLNSDLWSVVYDLKHKLSKQFIFDIQLLKGHSGIAGNERCDVIATTFADGEPAALYRGILSSYQISSILNIETRAGTLGSKSEKKKTSSKATPMGYVSIVDGVVERHKTWTECEKRVKGTKGAKFKKYFSEGDFDEIVGGWGQSDKK